MKLSPAMRMHLMYGIAGAPSQVFEALKRRGLIEPSERAGYWKLSAKGEETAEELRKTEGVK